MLYPQKVTKQQTKCEVTSLQEKICYENYNKDRGRGITKTTGYVKYKYIHGFGNEYNKRESLICTQDK